ncbi:MAG: hypothetical protein ISR91_03110 [Candidatus Delongbacteria bacterium]|nr:hypothetical protein [Candidatus Delongbacteria bacterium]
MKCITLVLLLFITASCLASVEHPQFRNRLDRAACGDSLYGDPNRTFPMFNFLAGDFVSRCGHPFLDNNPNQFCLSQPNPGFAAGIRLLSNSRDTAAWRPLYRLQSSLLIKPLTWLTVYHSFEVYSRDGADNPWSADWGGLYAGNREAFLLLRQNRYLLLAGRFSPITGPHGESSLLFSSNQSLDGYHFEFNLPLWNGEFWFTAGHWQLDDLQVYGGFARRYLAGHRLGYTRANSFSLALAEMLLYGGINAVPTAATLNPLLLYHAMQMNGFEGNTLYHLSGWWRPRKGLLFTMEFLLDDLQLDSSQPSDQEPAEWGMAVEARITPPRQPLLLALGYTRIAQRTYNSQLPYQRCQQRGQPLAHPNGSDFDQLSGRISFNGWPHLQPSLIATYTRSGERDLFADWDTPWLLVPEDHSFSEAFPTGVVEQKWSGTLRLNTQWRQGELILSATALSWKNYQHTSNRQDDFRIDLEFNLFLEHFISRGFTPRQS